ncbi:hypothetical protein BU26DRAFT_503422 [Trematosphaeria pertusa]|uniref:Protein kinase domain-containing protein n=1 Tax=Trematosphaeria pertusa TaxID=390896 RepID=A0A6A6IK87_9PLEO|nr:uncharacterized protein BU26DRAFT_503422 [Trematosphaeria pertusa]KAF2250796.1 hypothetical protein BU26DRAFT_503422 [Trematosphaeria pertusa]
MEIAKGRIPVIEGMPKHYVAISNSGGEVYFCMQKSDYVQARSHILRQGEDYFEDLKSKVVAVKVVNERSSREPSNKVRILATVHKQAANKDAARYFVSVTNYDASYDIRGEGDWVAFQALTSSLTLVSLQRFCLNDGVPIPEELLFHIFIELVSAGRFLHEECSPVITHNDLHIRNLMLDPTKQDFSGFPNLVVIDFGLASERWSTSDDCCREATTQARLEEIKQLVNGAADQGLGAELLAPRAKGSHLGPPRLNAKTGLSAKLSHNHQTDPNKSPAHTYFTPK